ncbi:MAG TPA: ABC transporter permease [Cellulomonas sp.]
MRSAIRSLVRAPAGVAGAVLVLVVLAVAALAPVLPVQAPLAQDLTHAFAPPAWSPGGSSAHLLGTDQLGRDVFSRLLHGTTVSLQVGLAATTVGAVVGIVLGAVSGYAGGVVDTVIMRVVDIQLAFPFILLAIFVASVLGPSLNNVIYVAALSVWVQFARLVRGEILSVKNQEYVAAARTLGLPSPLVLLRHVLPNVAGAIIVLATLVLADVILIEASLSFLGLGVPSETPTWGKMLSEARVYILTDPLQAVFPGAAITLTVLGVNLFGDWLRDHLDPRLRQVRP